MVACNVTYANEGSAVTFSLDFTDSNGVSFDIESLTEVRFQLCDPDGVIINDRSFENGLIDSENIVLTGDDLFIGDNGTIRYLGIKAVYDSSLGAGLTATFEEKFILNDLKNII